MKLFIQIPCFNEGATLAVALAALPRQVPGFDAVHWLVIDDGSSDDTVDVARANGVDHIVRHSGNRGLARAFMTGIETALSLGADVIVNTDADNQYNAADIPALTGPIVRGQAEMVIGARPISDIAHFSPVKKSLQKLGSWAVRVASKTTIPDAPSGFRAISRAAASRLMVFNDYTYTLETIIQAGQKKICTVSVPIRVNEDLRPSRLVKSIPSCIRRSVNRHGAVPERPADRSALPLEIPHRGRQQAHPVADPGLGVAGHGIPDFPGGLRRRDTDGPRVCAGGLSGRRRCHRLFLHFANRWRSRVCWTCLPSARTRDILCLWSPSMHAPTPP